MEKERIRIKASSISLVWILVCTCFVGMFSIFDDFVEEAQAITVPLDYPTIQEAIDAANPGDTILVWDGIYVENVLVNKTVTLIGNSSATTTIDGNQAGHTMRITSDFVNVSGFFITNASWNGIDVSYCSDTVIDDCNISSNNQFGIYLYDVYNGTINNSELGFNKNGGIYMMEWNTDSTMIDNCKIYNNTGDGINVGFFASDTQIIGCNISGNTGYGIYIWDSNYVVIKDTDIWENLAGIFSDFSYYITFEMCDIYSNKQYGIRIGGGYIKINDCNIKSNVNEGLFFEMAANYDVANTTISNHTTGMHVQSAYNFKVTNSSITNCTTNIYLTSSSHIDLLNTTFNKTRVSYGDSTSTILVRWFMHVYVNDSIDNPVPGAQVTVRNATGIGIFDGFTDLSGYARWITVTEYLENSSQRWYHTEHNITSYNGTNFGWAVPQPNMTSSKTVVVTLSQPMPTIDYIVIEDAIGGAAVGSRTYRIEDVVTFHAIAYNNILGFIGPVPATWSSNDPGVGDVVAGPDSKTTFTAYAEGTTFVTAQNISAIDTTGILTVIWLVENLNQTTVHPTIQKAINAANPGDWLLAKPWTYKENVRVNKTVTLMGTNKYTTIIDGTGGWTPVSVEASWVNISGFSFVKGGSGIAIMNTYETRIEDCLIHSNKGEGIYITMSEYTTIVNTEIYSNSGGITMFDFSTRYTTITDCYIHSNAGYGIYADMNPTDTVISDCNITNNTNDGIFMWTTGETTIKNSNIWNNNNGITMDNSYDNQILDSNVYSNNGHGIFLAGGSDHKVKNCNISNNYEGIYLSSIWNSEISNTSIFNHTYGIWAQSSSDCKITNSTILNPNPATDIYLASNSKITTLNTTFNKTSVNITDAASELIVRWFMHVNVDDIVGNPVSGAEVFIQNSSGALIFSDYTDLDGSIRWIVVTEYIENQTMRSYHTPHTVRATIGSSIVSKNVTMDISKLVMLQLASLQPAVELELVAGLQYSNINVDYDILASVTQDNQPRMHTSDTVILITIYDDGMNKVVEDDAMSLLDADFGLYSYSNITSGEGVYFVVAYFTASGISGIGLTSFEVVDWIEDISNLNESIGQIRDALDYLNLTTDGINTTLDGFIDGFGDFWNQFNGTDLSNLTNLLDWFNATMDMIEAFETNITSLLSNQNLDMARIDSNITAIDSFMQQAFSNLYENHTDTRDIISAYWDDWNTTIGQIQGNIGFLNTTLAQLASDLGWLNMSLNNLQEDIDYLNSTIPIEFGNLDTHLAGVNKSLKNQLTVMETNILNNLTSLNDTNIMGYLQGMNSTLFSEIQYTLASITDDVIGMNGSLSGELTNLLNTLATNNASLRNWLDIVLTQIDSNLTNTENVLVSKLNNLNATVTSFESNLQGNLAGLLTEIQMHDSIAGDNHTTIISKLDELLSDGVGEVDLSELKGMLIDLAFNLSSANESLANDLIGIVDDISAFQDQMNQDLADIDSALQDLDDIQEILTKLDDLNTNITEGNQQLEDKIDEIPKDKKEEEEAFGMVEMLLIIILVLLIINLLVGLIGRKGGKGAEVLPEERIAPKTEELEEEFEEEPEEEEWEEDEEESDDEREDVEEEEPEEQWEEEG